MTPKEFGQVYDAIRSRLITTLTRAYYMKRETAEDMVQDIAVQLLENPGRLASMNRPQVEAWFQQRRTKGHGGLKRRVDDHSDSEIKRQKREREWTGPHEKNFQVGAFIPEKDTDDSILNIRGTRAKVPLISRKGEFTEGVDACIDGLRPPPPPRLRGRPRKNSSPQPSKPKRKTPAQAVPATVDF